MKFSSACISVALVAFAASILPAEGADWNNGAGGIKDHGQGGTPVPAPIPYQDSYKYYFRADVGLGFNGRKPDVSHSGFNYGQGDLLSPLSLNNIALLDYSKGIHFPGTIGTGLYISERFRTDLTLDFRTRQKFRYGGAYSYVADRDSGLAVGLPATGVTSTGIAVGSTVAGYAEEKMTNRVTVLMANAYYDFGKRSSFTPYIGAGLGFAVNRYDSQHTTSDETITPPAGVGCLPACRSGATGSTKGNEIGFAGALMAGMSYSLGHSAVIDLNYRAQYLQGFDLTKTVVNNGAGTVGGVGKLTVGDTWDHQLRAGIRFHVW